MKLEDQVSSLEPSKRLKELGVKQKSLWYWQYDSSDHKWDLSLCKPELADGIYTSHRSAFTVAELGEMLPRTIELASWICGREIDGYRIAYVALDAGMLEPEIKADSEADARAKMLIYLIEQGLMKI